jgi:two-component system sensor histidine kinase HydH
MPTLSIRSLRTQLQIFSLLLVAAPGALLAVIALVNARQALGTAVGRHLAEVAHDTLAELDGSLAEQARTVRSWARQDVMRDVLVDDIDKRIARFLVGLKASGAPYLDFVCVDRTGRVLAATNPASLGEMLGARDWARTTLAGGDFLSGPLGSPAVLEIASPIFHPDQPEVVIGALLGTYDWRHAMALPDRIRRTLLPHGLTVDIVVVGRDGAAIGESWRDSLPEPTRDRHRAAVAGIVARLPAGPVGSITEQGTRSVVGYARGVPAHGWLALVMEPVSEALGPVFAIERRMAVALVAVLLGGLAVATFLAGRMTRPLRELTMATRRVAREGATLRPVAVRSRDEIGELAAAFNAMTAELKRAQEHLLVAAKFAFAGEMAAGIAHEVRTPLGIMRSSAQMLARSAPPEHPEFGELVQMIVEEVDRLDRVVAGLLEVARPHAPLIESTRLAPVLARALDFVDSQAREKGVRIERAITANGAPARCDPDQIYQVALNLVVNALQALGTGGTLTVRTLPARAGRVGFEVSDDGPGIPPNVRERVFDPFFTSRKGGTGLGLALVQRVVEAHKGSVSVESEVGRGTTFRVELPAAEGGA